MILGTAGFTAAQCVQAIVLNGVTPDAGEIVVTGATGGVGCLAVKLLAKLGYTVVAVTGKPHLESRLKAWGASRIISRDGCRQRRRDKPMLAARWAGAVDTVGGETLATIIRETKPYGVVSACGLVGGDRPAPHRPSLHPARRHARRHRLCAAAATIAAWKSGGSSATSGGWTDWKNWRRRSAWPKWNSTSQRISEGRNRRADGSDTLLA